MTALLIFTTIAMLLLASLILFFVYSNRRRQLLFAESLQKIQTDYEKNLLNVKLEMQEEVFRHIAREIHDNISLSLTLAKLQLNTFDWTNIPVSNQKIEQSLYLLSRSIDDLSKLSRGLNTDLLQQQGLIHALKEEIERIRKTGLFGVEFSLSGNPVFMEARKELMIFRVIQEAFNNIIKHAGAKNARLEMNYTNELSVSIRDDGAGFDKEMMPGSGSGLTNMEGRIKLLGGSFSVTSFPGKGTTILFTIPIEQLV
jgi:two-component system, NarL family, sensor kinase